MKTLPPNNESETMGTTFDAPLQWVESITMLRLPELADQRLQVLMDRDNEGNLSDVERADWVNTDRVETQWHR